ncbi:protein NRT1/ PTR FAMILY 1.2-like [Gastrolobium bilobum]|uniref:protein NRT1/ PTR FAMILY 1.2-like n=1 Tax=Gastrolobium bilobum TaxID=150636 RepID=UPI002AB31805|nr:protein NRT1/ PTR FAMILY 1.2-like [Gastrolobium bilobum]
MEKIVKEKEPLISITNRKGGFRTLPFIIANQAFEKMASFGILPNMILYLTRDYGMEAAEATNVILFWSAATNFTPVVGAFIADSYAGRYPTIAFGSVVSFLGTLLFWLTAMIPELSPSCDQFTKRCSSPTTTQLAFLYSSLGLMSIGAGGVRASSLAFGIDQLDRKDKDVGVIESYFNWSYALTAVAILIGMTNLVYIQENFGWKVGFGVPVVLMFMSMVSFFLASSLYVKLEAKGNVISGCARVVIASYRNRHLSLPLHVSNDMYYCEKESTMLMPSDKLRFLNKACLIKNSVQDLTQNGRAENPWNLCTVDEVEALKALIKIIPIWITGMIMSVNLSQGSFSVLEASSMDRHITSHFEIPAASMGTFMIISTAVWIVLYDRVVIPSTSKIAGLHYRLRVKQKMGIGLFAVCLSTASLAVVEGIRRKMAIEEGFSEYPEGVVNMSVLWLLPRQVLDGFAEAFNAVGQNEFFICELPQSMSSIGSTLSGLGMSGANLIASLLMSVVDKVTKGEGKVSWVSSNINKGHYDYYYWLIFGLMLANLLYFLYCSKAYGPCKGEENEGQDERH